MVQELEGRRRAAAATRVMLNLGPSGNRWLSCRRRPRRSLPRLLRRTMTPRQTTDSEHSECTATVAEMESTMGPSHPASILLHTQLEEGRRRSAMGTSRCWRRSRLRKSGSKRDRDLWRPLLRSETAAHDKLHEALTLRREQEAELMDLCAQVAADLPLAAATPVRSEEGRKTIMEALDALSNERPAATLGAHRRCAGGALAVGGHDGDAPSPGSCSGIHSGH